MPTKFTFHVGATLTGERATLNRSEAKAMGRMHPKAPSDGVRRFCAWFGVLEGVPPGP